MDDFTLLHGDCPPRILADAAVAALEARVAKLEAEHRYPHMCRDGHPEIGHSTDGERCPVCLERDRAEKAEAELAAMEARRCPRCRYYRDETLPACAANIIMGPTQIDCCRRWTEE